MYSNVPLCSYPSGCLAVQRFRPGSTCCLAPANDESSNHLIPHILTGCVWYSWNVQREREKEALIINDIFSSCMQILLSVNFWSKIGWIWKMGNKVTSDICHKHNEITKSLIFSPWIFTYRYPPRFQVSLTILLVFNVCNFCYSKNHKKCLDYHIFVDC